MDHSGLLVSDFSLLGGDVLHLIHYFLLEVKLQMNRSINNLFLSTERPQLKRDGDLEGHSHCNKIQKLGKNNGWKCYSGCKTYHVWLYHLERAISSVVCVIQ